LRAAAAAFNVSPATAHRWWRRWLVASQPERASGRCLGDRSSRPHHQRRRLTAAQEEPILRARPGNPGPGRRPPHHDTPYTPRWNGKAERFIQTLQNEWAYVHRWQSSSQRARALSSFVRYYNRRRPHSSLGDRPPISRAHNLREQDT
jgi:transposase InsO family protein